MQHAGRALRLIHGARDHEVRWLQVAVDDGARLLGVHVRQAPCHVHRHLRRMAGTTSGGDRHACSFLHATIQRTICSMLRSRD